MKKCYAKKNFFWLNNLAILYRLCILDISYLQPGAGGDLISIAYCPFFHLFK